MKQIDWTKCPEKFRGGLQRWVEAAILPGSFLCAALKNDMAGAVLAGDDETLDLLPMLCMFMVSELPSTVWGSESAFETYPKRVHDKRNQVQHQ